MVNFMPSIPVHDHCWVRIKVREPVAPNRCMVTMRGSDGRLMSRTVNPWDSGKSAGINQYLLNKLSVRGENRKNCAE